MNGTAPTFLINYVRDIAGVKLHTIKWTLTVDFKAEGLDFQKLLSQFEWGLFAKDNFYFKFKQLFETQTKRHRSRKITIYLIKQIARHFLVKTRHSKLYNTSTQCFTLMMYFYRFKTSCSFSDSIGYKFLTNGLEQ